MSVNSPSVNNLDDATGITYQQSSNLPWLLNLLALTGAQYQLPAQGDLLNASYTVEANLPRLRCQESNDEVRSATVELALTSMIPDLELTNETGNILYPLNTTVNGSAGSAYLGYYAIKGESFHPPELSIALANPPPFDTNSTISKMTIPSTPYRVSYYTCAALNASIAMHVGFTNNLPSMNVEIIKEAAYSLNPLQQTPIDFFTSAMFDLFTGSIFFHSISSSEKTGTVTSVYDTHLDSTVFATARDYSKVAAAWGGPRVDNASIREKNLTELIEEFSLNASVSLMTMSEFR
jgi:hypothetical protein